MVNGIPPKKGRLPCGPWPSSQRHECANCHKPIPRGHEMVNHHTGGHGERFALVVCIDCSLKHPICHRTRHHDSDRGVKKLSPEAEPTQ